MVPEQNNPSDREDAMANMPRLLEVAPDGTPQVEGLLDEDDLRQFAAKQPQNFLWKMAVWNEPRLALALRPQRGRIGWFLSGLARCLATVGARNWAAGLLRWVRRRSPPGWLRWGERLQLVLVMLPGRRGHELAPDATFFLARFGRSDWERVLRKGGRVRLVNFEFVKELAAPKDIAQLWSYGSGYRDRLGALLQLWQAVVITYQRRGWWQRWRRRWLTLFEEYLGVRLRVPLIYVDECRVAWIPEAALDTLYGAWGVLLFPDGRNPEMVASALRRWYDNPELWASKIWACFVCTFLDEYPELHQMFKEEDRKVANTESLAEGNPAPQVIDTPGSRLMLDLYLGRYVKDPKDLPRVKKEVEKGREEGREEGRQEGHVDSLLAVLRGRTIWLPSEQVAKLRNMGCAELPAMQVALDATDAEDFARRAGL